jgi:pimeloyl-ACP methyl ester carboxylesterase
MSNTAEDALSGAVDLKKTAARSGLPNPLAGSRSDFVSIAGRLASYSAGTRPPGDTSPPLLLIHSINAAGSAFEVKPLYDLYATRRQVHAIDLPGFGLSDRSDRPYTARVMTDAIHATVERLRAANGGAPIDAVALSLSCEFLARAAHEQPDAFRSVAFISPTGFEGKARDQAKEETRGMPWVLKALEVPLWRRGFFKLLTARPVMRKFLEKTWGSKHIDEPMLDYDYASAHQEGARHAPYYFVAGYLFSKDVLRIYQSLRLPVWMVHGVRGDFVDYHHKTRVAEQPNWSIEVFQTGAFPHFEVLDQVAASYDAFLAKVEQNVS